MTIAKLKKFQNTHTLNGLTSRTLIEEGRMKRQPQLDAVEYHRQWQETLDEHTLFEQLAKETEKMLRM